MADIMKILPELEGKELATISTLVNSLTDEQGFMFATGYRGRRKRLMYAWLFFALCLIWLGGIHRFYLRSIFLGVVYLLTWGFFGIGLIIDLFLINSMTHSYNVRVAQEVLVLVKGSSNQAYTTPVNTNQTIKPSFCSDCGTPLGTTDRFCAECGKAY